MAYSEDVVFRIFRGGCGEGGSNAQRAALLENLLAKMQLKNSNAQRYVPAAKKKIFFLRKNKCENCDFSAASSSDAQCFTYTHPQVVLKCVLITDEYPQNPEHQRNCNFLGKSQAKKRFFVQDLAEVFF